MGIFAIPTDPDVLAQVVRDRSPLLDDVEGEPEPEPDAPIDWHAEFARLRPLLDRVPPCEADTFELFYYQRKHQADIGAIFGISQAAVSYRLQATRQRLKFLLAWPGVHLTEEGVREALNRVKSQFEGGHRRRKRRKQSNGDITVDILCTMLRTTSQTQTARDLGQSQSVVNYRFHEGIAVIDIWRQIFDELDPIHQALVMVADHPNILCDLTSEKNHRGRSHEYSRRTTARTRQQLANYDALAELERLTR